MRRRLPMSPEERRIRRAILKQGDFTPAERVHHERLWRVLRAVENVSEQDITPEQWLDALPEFMNRRFVEHLSSARPWLEELFRRWDEYRKVRP